MLFIRSKNNFMKLFKRSLGYYIFWTSFIYFWVSMYNLFINRFTDSLFIQIVWLFILSLPLWFKPLARFLNTNTLL